MNGSSEKAWSDPGKVRAAFIDFFVKDKEHVAWESSPVVPHDDPTLLFINAGMNQFKPLIEGKCDHQSAMGKLRRAANSQKCIRAGGKHNDLEDVGKDVYHHTFFEMLGNWSFGDYYKSEAIDWAWELLTKVYGLDSSRLYATYYGGDPKNSCPPDDEAKRMWERHLPPERILACGAKDNFWEMAETGPCGPCSEIHYDRIGGGRDAASLVNADDPDVIEIWNLVFMQYNRQVDGILKELPAKHIDTGMGFERLVSVLNDVRSNYDTQLFLPLFAAIQKVAPQAPPYRGRVGAQDVDGVDMAYRVIADHIRTLSVALADGAKPDNAGRGYVLRRILRRAVRYGRQFLQAPKDKTWFASLVPAVLESLGSVFPELKQQESVIVKILEEEEKQFAVTLDRGLREFEKTCSKLGGSEKVFPGGIGGAFTLFTTFGFPLDLTELMAQEKGLRGVDNEAFEEKFREHQDVSKGTAQQNLVMKDMEISPDRAAQLELQGAPRTDDVAKYEWDTRSGTGPVKEARVVAIFHGNDILQSCSAEQLRDMVKAKRLAQGHEMESCPCVGVLLDSTTFYAEAGGQVADTGVIEKDEENQLRVTACHRYGSYVNHIGTLTGTLAVGDKVALKVEYQRRGRIAKNHTATHLLNFALRKVLKTDADQRGSYVDSAKLRFDFAFGEGLKLEQLEAVEEEVMSFVSSKAEVSKAVLPLEKARTIPGLRFMAGEAYPDPVRVVAVGANAEALAGMSGVGPDGGEGGFSSSVEFCGGTHLENATDIGQFIILKEEALAKGIRRITAVTGSGAQDAIKERESLCEEYSDLVCETRSQGMPSISALNQFKERIGMTDMLPLVTKIRWRQALDRALERSRQAAKEATKKATEQAFKLGSDAAREVNEAVLAVQVRELPADPKALEEYAKGVTSGGNISCFAVGVDTSDDSFVALSYVAADHAKAVDASKWLNEALSCCGGKGGGKGHKATGKAKNASEVPRVLEAARKAFLAMLG